MSLSSQARRRSRTSHSTRPVLEWIAEHGHTVVGTIHDLGVSASVGPFERPDLGPWLSDDKSARVDVLVFSKLDRLFRSTRDCVRFAECRGTLQGPRLRRGQPDTELPGP